MFRVARAADRRLLRFINSWHPDGGQLCRHGFRRGGKSGWTWASDNEQSRSKLLAGGRASASQTRSITKREQATHCEGHHQVSRAACSTLRSFELHRCTPGSSMGSEALVSRPTAGGRPPSGGGTWTSSLLPFCRRPSTRFAPPSCPGSEQGGLHAAGCRRGGSQLEGLERAKP